MRIRSNRITRNSIREAFDNLASGACYFNRKGMLILCNHTMMNLAWELLGADLQYEREFAEAVSDLENRRFQTAEGRMYEFRINEIDGIGNEYIATDITELIRENRILRERNKELEEMVANVDEMNRNIAAIAREEEVLSLKVQIHNDLGGDLLRIHNYYAEGCPPDGKRKLVEHIERTLSILKGESEPIEEYNSLEELRQAADAVGVELLIEGSMPAEREAFQLVVLAMRESVTNTVRHAKGDRVLIHIRETDREYELTITNNGTIPPGTIVEGGGLSGLRHKVEKAGGTMRIDGEDEFRLRLSIPRKE